MIREYLESDKEHILELFRLNTPMYFAPCEEAGLRSYLESGDKKYFVLLNDDGNISGSGGYAFTEEGKEGLIIWDIIHPQHQRKGTGSRLLTYRLEKLKAQQGLRKIKVRTSQLAYAFYEKHGFVLIESKVNHWAEGFDLYAMEMTLSFPGWEQKP